MYLDATIKQFPELFLAEITAGYKMKDIRESGYPVEASSPYMLWSAEFTSPTIFWYGVGGIPRA
ncbi:MAG: hypothetical protein C4B58_02870 [Deltaproteobacteria bacterium]|nr:MAG: hypothetical protein C4B58_02870 [Deltaproteobacteria bacterium]